MAHGSAKQVWFPGATVKVGFLTLTVIGRMPTPRDGRPDEWLMKNGKGEHYSFQPHLGISKLYGEQEIARAHARVRSFAEAA